MSATTTLKEQVLTTLKREQANAVVMYLNYKKYHWLTYGPLFRDLHLLFEEQGSEVFAMIDELAERSLMLDGQPVADPADYLKVATVTPSSGQLTVKQMIEEAIANHELIITEMHQDAEIATEAGDIGTADLYTRLVQTHQKHRWFLKEFLAKGDGLVS
ncbi:Dps family protein [Thermosynechococcus vestitus]|uniref:Dps family DNA-binding stress response protein n=1 Tax=Thermosynechococcus vestitus (strain NIES-2133 / IAM M-273 / BP-1) TaxID=197221 RepID=Q8DG54_THEVB|nr:DNA starvation/stationary phase protection protein [Thermosynechococcus vestitus]2C41_A Chain A, DPS FAMILY DNA-BINDING STRESS RESPONSE PROTEIN [Thermosynechococcus vestitus BP-1]2C41_B Chain B, DPS FAMILY DNA-BINDING STRESS RESPONSE PROTEIN [Thermosynechococcus vestitus BP-1]2C41_C Chain C, DPS FAMILY DNA-BINDING STRESS RESPONSE PROTEIN [Thermosynechococcus vestitus BP-1]2C41_D Chain D, DPS FAMILY DNA-BINDING STRESS RESPONSE PROTEIN [Thermosynechococcus vestitus BP-1]2C41_E Chain E, DPS FA